MTIDIKSALARVDLADVHSIDNELRRILQSMGLLNSGDKIHVCKVQYHYSDASVFHYEFYFEELLVTKAVAMDDSNHTKLQPETFKRVISAYIKYLVDLQNFSSTLIGKDIFN